MNLLSNRQHQILKRILNIPEFVTINQLAKAFNLSERTIQYDIEYLEAMAKTIGYHMVRRKGEGIKALCDDVKSIENKIGNLHFSQCHLTKEERQTLLKLLLLEQDVPLSTQALANHLSVSRRTLASDIKAMTHWFTSHHLELAYVNNKGFEVKGNEADYRKTYAQLLHEYYENMNGMLTKYFDATADLKTIRTIIIQVLKQEKYPLVQTAIEGLVLHILIAVKRIKQNYPLLSATNSQIEQKHEKHYRIATYIKQEIETHFHITFPVSELDLIALHLMASKSAILSPECEREAALKRTIHTFVNCISSEMGIEFFTDQQLIQGLMIHLSPAIYRFQHQLHQVNPLYDNIVEEYGELMRTIERYVTLFEADYEVQFNAHEMSYLALHFASSFERLRSRKNQRLKVILLCGSGVGTSQLLNAKLSNVYPEFDIMEAYSIYEMSEEALINMQVDLVISTVPTSFQMIRSVNISPLLTQNDISKLNRIINAQRESKVNPSTSQSMALNELLTDSRIFETTRVISFEEAVAQTVAPLEQEGIVTDAYKNEIIDKLNDLGPYMVIGPHIALIHGSTTYVNGVGMSLGYFKNGVTFHHRKFDPVKVIVCLATENTTVHLKALKQLSERLFNEDLRNKLLNGHISEFKNNINAMEEEVSWL